MSEYFITTCDLCAPSGIKSAVEKGNSPKKGYATCEVVIAITDLGWEEQEVGHVCPTCIAEQKAQAERDEAEEAHSGLSATDRATALALLEAEETKLLSKESKAKAQKQLKGSGTTYKQWVAGVKALYANARAQVEANFPI